MVRGQAHAAPLLRELAGAEILQNRLVQVSGIQGSSLSRVWDFGILGFWFLVSGFWFRVSGFGHLVLVF